MAPVLELDSIEIDLAGGLRLLIWGSGVSAPDLLDLPHRSRGQYFFGAKSFTGGSKKKLPIRYCEESPSEGAQALVFYENTTYRWRLTGTGSAKVGEAQILSTLKNPVMRRSRCEWTEEHFKDAAPEGSFRVTNYLGTAEISVDGGSRSVVRFEVQSRKFDFHEEYRAMVEDIAEHCRQLLLEWDSPTSFSLSADPEERRATLLEQFLFLRHFLGGEKLDFHLEMIARNPHSLLVQEEEWMPASVADPSEFASNPFRNSRGWTRSVPAGVFSVTGATPGELIHVTRDETLDTAPNRFVLFALTSFRDLCREVVALHDERRGTAYLEAAQMMESLDAFLARPFFLGISPLDRLPLENQTLQKREGYRDLLKAWLMLEAAAKLDWPGRGEAYDGTNRDAATLYEYWLYFILLDVLKKRLGMSPITKMAGRGNFISQGQKGGALVSLEKGKESVSSLVWKSREGTELGIHFFYNRKFSKAPDPKSSGSYSQAFWPDYTLAFFPIEYMNSGDWKKDEEAALKAGRIAFLHFDAKYRLDFQESPLGADDDASLESEQVETQSTDTYKRGDLYKMHTYNDAIRRTAGSYVLYPGQDGEPKVDFPRYEEVAPGVGAFRMRPGGAVQREICEKAISDFIADVLKHHGNTFSRNYRINYWTESTVRETPPSYAGSSVEIDADGLPAADAQVLVVGYRSREIADLGKRGGFVYLHAVDEMGTPSKVTPDLLKADVLLPYNFEIDTPPEWCGWFARIRTSRLVPRDKLIKNYLRDVSMIKSGTLFYYVIEFEDLRDIDPKLLRAVKSVIPPVRGIPVGKSWESLTLR